MVEVLTQEQLDEALMTLHEEWNVEDNDCLQLTRQIEFGNFSKAIEFVYQLKEISEELNHTADVLIHTQGQFVEILLTTYEVEDLTQKDLDFAFRVDGLLM